MGRKRWFWAATAPGLEEVLAAEITELGGESVAPGHAGVGFQGEAKLGYSVVMWARSAMRVFEELSRNRINSPDDVYEAAKDVPWERYIRPGQTIAVDAVGRNPHFRNLHVAALKVKDAVADRMREKAGERPDVDAQAPDVPLRVALGMKVITISRDLSGFSLHRRGYRDALHKSPLNEAVAAGLILHTGWDGTTSLVDPMCGSGTFLVEAAMIAADQAPGLGRQYAFENWTDRDREGWANIVEDAEARAKAPADMPTLLGNDRHRGALEMARRSAKRAGFDIPFDNEDVSEWIPAENPAFVMTNPPWGERLQPADIGDSWHGLGTFLHERCSGTSAWVLAGDGALTRSLRMRAARKHPVAVGGIDCRWLHYPVR